MAPSSSVKKKATATKRSSKAAKPKRALAVQRTKIRTKALPPKELPSDWPVESRIPSFPPTASALRPGSLLQRVCSGSDIQLTRSAATAPSLEKKKGRFLCIFPGNFSFGRITENLPPNEDESPSDQQSATKAESITPAVARTMGRIEGLQTNDPVFRIPFPHLQKSLLFPGKKVPTTSKFLAMACSNKKSGTVQCKSIFSSAIVFGLPKWVACTKSQRLAETTTAKPEMMQMGAKRTILHYGGSERTVDGATRTRNHAASVSTENVTNKHVPILYHQQASSLDFSTAKTTVGKKSVTKPPPAEESDDEYIDETPKPSKPPSSTKQTRSAPRRKTSKKKASENYAENSSGSDDDYHVDDEEMDVDSSSPETTKKPARNTTKARAKATRSSRTIKKKNIRETETNQEIISVDDNTSSASSQSLSPDSNITAASIVRRRSRGTKRPTYKEIDESDIEESEEESNESDSEDAIENDSKIVNSNSKPRGRQRETKSTSKGRQAPSMKRKAESKSTASSSKQKTHASTAITASKRIKRPTSRATKGSKVAASVERSPLAKSPSSLTSPGGIRRRKKKSSPMKKARSTVLDLTQDDEFTFGG